jgi:hypothetical protein
MKDVKDVGQLLLTALPTMLLSVILESFDEKNLKEK